MRKQPAFCFLVSVVLIVGCYKFILLHLPAIPVIMKRPLLPILIAFFAFPQMLIAQSTLTATDLSMQMGELYLMAEMANPFAPPFSWSFINSPVAGPNQTWDFSAFIPANSYTVSILNRNAAPLPNKFSVANMVVKNGVRDKYLQNAGSKIINWGTAEVTPNNTFIWENDIPFDEMRFPVTITSAYSDTFTYKVPGYYNNTCVAVDFILLKPLVMVC